MPSIKPIEPKYRLEVLSLDQLEAIKSATLHVLEHIGVQFPSERALSVFAQRGAQVDLDSQVVRLSPDLVLEAMSRETRAFSEREYLPVWPPAGKTMLEMARAEALDILHCHQPPPLPAGALDRIKAIAAEADKALAEV